MDDFEQFKLWVTLRTICERAGLDWNVIKNEAENLAADQWFDSATPSRRRSKTQRN